MDEDSLLSEKNEEDELEDLVDGITDDDDDDGGGYTSDSEEDEDDALFGSKKFESDDDDLEDGDAWKGAGMD